MLMAFNGFAVKPTTPVVNVTLNSKITAQFTLTSSSVETPKYNIHKGSVSYTRQRELNSVVFLYIRRIFTF